MGRITHTYVTLPVSDATFQEITDALLRAGYGHVFNSNYDPDLKKNVTAIDMHGLALVRKDENK